MKLPVDIALCDQYLIKVGSSLEFVPATLTCLTIGTVAALKSVITFSFPLRSLVMIRKSHFFITWVLYTDIEVFPDNFFTV